MSLKFKYDALVKSKDEPEEKGNSDTENSQLENYKTYGQVRNICFVQADGKKAFLNYAYLVSGEYNSKDSSILLAFTSHEVKIKGNNLESLFKDLALHLPKKIECIELRYLDKGSDDICQITDIDISKN